MNRDRDEASRDVHLSGHGVAPRGWPAEALSSATHGPTGMSVVAPIVLRFGAAEMSDRATCGGIE